jgi:hypothetical protein
MFNGNGRESSFLTHLDICLPSLLPLSRWNSTDNQDLVTTNRLLQTFAQKDVTFPSTREAKFAHELMQACEEADVERYTSQIYQYDQVTKLDNWKTGVLLKIKKALEEDEGGLT